MVFRGLGEGKKKNTRSVYALSLMRLGCPLVSPFLRWMGGWSDGELLPTTLMCFLRAASGFGEREREMCRTQRGGREKGWNGDRLEHKDGPWIIFQRRGQPC